MTDIVTALGFLGNLTKECKVKALNELYLAHKVTTKFKAIQYKIEQYN